MIHVMASIVMQPMLATPSAMRGLAKSA